MPPLYDLTPQVLFETKKKVDPDELEAARKEYAARIHPERVTVPVSDAFGRPTGQVEEIPAGLSLPAQECSDIAVEIAERFGGRLVRDPHARAIETHDTDAWLVKSARGLVTNDPE